MKKRYILMSVTILLLILIDQVVKRIVVSNKLIALSNGENIKYIQNFAGAFGIGGNSTFFFILVNIVVLGIIIKFIYSQKDRIDKKTLTSLTLILAGGSSNLIDRIFRGYVVDYIDITKYMNFPAFNIADILIVVGWVMLIISIIIYWNTEIKVMPNKEENS